MRDNIAEEDTPPWVYVQDKIFPRSRQLFLDKKILKKLGITQRVIRERDFLFFYQIMFPLCDTSLSVIREDKWLPYYSEVDKWSNLYDYQIGPDGSYGHRFTPVVLLLQVPGGTYFQLEP